VPKLKSNAEWELWGKDDPLWGVASWASKQKGGDSPWTEEEFYALGESDWRDFLCHWQQYGLDKRSCLEIGCGAGRLTKQLARSFEHVCAVDVSEHMIDRARKAVADVNVEFSVIDGLHLPQSDCSVSAIFSAHVLQHLDSVDVGGTIMIHFPIYQFPKESGFVGKLMAFEYTAYRAFGSIRANINRHLGVKGMRGTPYPIKDLTLFLTDLGFSNIEFRIFPLKSNGEPHPFVFATK